MNELYEKGPFGYFIFFDNGTLHHINSTAASLLKVDGDQVKNQPVESIFTLSTRIFYQTHLFPLVKIQGHAEEIFITLLASDGQHIPVLMNVQKIEAEEKPAIACAFIVVHNRKKFEDELVAARDTAEKALSENTALIQAKDHAQQQASNLETQIKLVNRQNEELQQFHHVITHSLKEPLRKVLLYGSLVTNEFASHALDRMLASANQLKLVVFGLQQYVWLNEKQNEFTQVDLKETVKLAVEQVNQEGYPGLLHLTTDSLGTVSGDIDQLQLLFYHVLLNAVVYRKNDPANVTITSQVIKQNTFRHVQGKYQYEDFIRISVKDDGRGFDPSYTKHIFELFRKLHQKPGNGLGLALCKKIADNHHGSISADSKEGEFTIISILLPLNQVQ
jgi:sigma-B regulation protein RsbU (phosphoserine phosphatase)